MKNLTVVLASILFASTVSAAPYVSPGISFVEDQAAATLAVGIDTPNDALGIEARYSSGTDVEMSGIYGKLRAPAETIQPYMVIGYSDVEVDGVSDTDISWGVGVEYRPAEDVAVGVEYMSYTGYSSPEIDGVNIKLTMEF